MRSEEIPGKVYTMSFERLPGFALPQAEPLMTALRSIVLSAPFRHMVTPGGLAMSMASTNCGQFGWITDRRGYRYADRDPATGEILAAHAWRICADGSARGSGRGIS